MFEFSAFQLFHCRKATETSESAPQRAGNIPPHETPAHPPRASSAARRLIVDASPLPSASAAPMQPQLSAGSQQWEASFPQPSASAAPVQPQLSAGSQQWDASFPQLSASVHPVQPQLSAGDQVWGQERAVARHSGSEPSWCGGALQQPGQVTAQATSAGVFNIRILESGSLVLEFLVIEG